MKQLLIDVSLFEITPQMLKESYDKSGRFVVSGVLQRANAKFLKEKLKNTRVEKSERTVHMVNLTTLNLQLLN